MRLALDSIKGNFFKWKQWNACESWWDNMWRVSFLVFLLHQLYLQRRKTATQILWVNKCCRQWGSHSTNWACFLSLFPRISKCIYQFWQTEKCIAFHFFHFCRSRGFWHSVQHLEATDESRTEGFELDLTHRHAATSEPASDTSVCLDIASSPTSKSTQLSAAAGGNLRNRQWNKYTRAGPCVRSMTGLTRRELPGEKITGEAAALYLSRCVSAGSFHFILTAKARQTEISPTENRMSELRRETCCSIVVFVWFLKTGLAAASASLSEYKRCLRGNISEVLCWWLAVWQTSGVKRQVCSRIWL